MATTPSGPECPLSERELEVLRLAADGLTAREIAAALSIAPRTVEHHLDHAKLKTRTRNRVHTIAYVVQAGLLGRNVRPGDLADDEGTSRW